MKTCFLLFRIIATDRLSHAPQERESTISQFLQNFAVRPKLRHTAVQHQLDGMRSGPSGTSFNMAAAAETNGAEICIWSIAFSVSFATGMRLCNANFFLSTLSNKTTSSRGPLVCHLKFLVELLFEQKMVTRVTQTLARRRTTCFWCTCSRGSRRTIGRLTFTIHWSTPFAHLAWSTSTTRTGNDFLTGHEI